MRFKRFGIGLSALLAVVVVTGIVVTAQGTNASDVDKKGKVKEKPFKISGGGGSLDGLNFPNPNPDPDNPLRTFEAAGTATQLGNYTTEDGRFEVTSFGPSDPESEFDAEGEFFGFNVFVAANGDRLKCNFQASSTPELDGTGKFYGKINPEDGSLTATFIQEFTPDLTPGVNTGRFAKVTGGSWIMIATSDPVFSTNGEIDGYFNVPFTFTWVGDGFLKWKN